MQNESKGLPSRLITACTEGKKQQIRAATPISSHPQVEPQRSTCQRPQTSGKNTKEQQRLYQFVKWHLCFDGSLFPPTLSVFYWYNVHSYSACIYFNTTHYITSH